MQVEEVRRMERLTIPDVRVDEHTTRRTMIDARAVKNHAMEFYWRLKAYEDTGLTPEEIDMDHEAAEQLRHLCRDCDLDRLEELAEADKGRCVVALPCKAGDTVYYWDGCQIIDYKVENFSVFDGNEWLMRGVHREGRNGIGFGREFWAHEFYYCKTVFLTREEAEKALEAMKDE